MPTTTEIVIPETSPRRIGIVESDKRNKTRKVVIAYSGKHAKYGKYMRKRTVLQVHDEKNESHLGDRVEVAECRPLSKTKSCCSSASSSARPRVVPSASARAPETVSRVN